MDNLENLPEIFRPVSHQFLSKYGTVWRTWEGIHGPSLSEQNTWHMTLFLFSTVLLSAKIKYSTNFFGFTTSWQYLHWTVMKLRLWIFLHYSVQFSRSVMSDSLQPHEPQHARPSCPSPTPGVHPNPCPLSRWCHSTISSSVIPFSSCPQSLPASGSFPVSQFFTSGGQSTGVSASASVLPMNIQDWSPLGRTSWISFQSKRLLRVFSNTTVQKHQFLSAQLSL